MAIDRMPVVTPEGRLDLERLREVLRDEGVVGLGVLSEGALYWLGPAAGGPIPDAPDQATLLAMRPDQRDAHMVQVAAALGAADELMVDDADTPRRLGRSGPRAMVAALRGTAAARTVVRRSDSGDLVAIVHDLPIGADLVQHPDADDTAIHRFTCRRPEVTARWLAGVVDPGAHAWSTGAIRRASAADDLHPDPQRLRAAPTAHTLVRVRADRSTARSIEMVAGPGVGVVVLRDFRTASARQVVTRTLGPDDLVAACDAFLHAPDGPGDGPVHDGRR